MEKFVETAKQEGGDSDMARTMWRSGYTAATVEKAREIGLTYKDLEAVYGLFGATSALVVNEILSRIKK